MAKVTYKNKTYTCDPEKSLLNNVLSQGGFLPYSCMEGVCHACMMCATEGTPPPESQRGLHQARINQNCFLACQCKGNEDMTITPPPETLQQTFTAQLVERTQLDEHVFLLSFQCPIGFDFHAGQFVNIIHPETKNFRSYSIASIPSEGYLEFHIRHIPQGQVSSWLCEQAKLGDEVNFEGAFGDCYYASKSIHQPLILAGSGTGLAPLYGILKAAIYAGHQGEIQLFHQAYSEGHLYYHDKLKALAEKHENITYIPCVQQGNIPQGGASGDIAKIVSQAVGDGAGKKAYVCGNPDTVSALNKALFMVGVAKDNIYADAFIPQK